MPSPIRKRILFTAFEPSGDAHAAPVIAELLRRITSGGEEIEISAWGGPCMLSAGADVTECSVDNAVMGAEALSKVREHHRINKRIASWLREHPETMIHVPVDSPAANFPICRITRKAGCRVVHLVAPQIWAWGPWRVRKLRRLTDHVLCLLPFEEKYFRDRNVPATFIGHPVINDEQRQSEPNPPGVEAASAADVGPKLAVLPGSRASEIRHNLPAMLHIIDQLRTRHPRLFVLIPAAHENAKIQIQSAIERYRNGRNSSLACVTGELDSILCWADAALTCSGTATLDLTRHRLPMVVMYRMSRLPWICIGRWMIRTPLRALPNLIAGKKIVPEFIPHFGPTNDISAVLAELLTPSPAAHAQREGLESVLRQFDHHHPASEAADQIMKFL